MKVYKTRELTALSHGSLALMIMLAAACGRDEGRDDAAEASAPGETALPQSQDQLAQTANQPWVFDPKVTGDHVIAQVDEAISSALEDPKSGAGLSLVDLDVKMQQSRACTANADGSAKVDIKRGFEGSWDFNLLVAKGSIYLKGLTDRSRLWSKAGTTIACSEDKKSVVIDRANMHGMKLDVQIARERTRKLELSNILLASSFLHDFSFTADGTRQVQWEVLDSDTSLVENKTITQNLTRKLSTTNMKGEKTELEATVGTAKEAPLVIEVVRDKKTDEVKSHTLVKGSLVAAIKDGSRIETNFDQVKYQPSAKCMAVSGKISGNIYKPSDATPVLTYLIDFDADGTSIKFSDGRTVNFAVNGCEFEDPTKGQDVANVTLGR